MPENPLKQLRIFVGFNSAGAAGIYAYTRILKKRGYQIDFYGIGRIRYDMPVDFLLEFSSNRFLSFFQRVLCFFRLLPIYDLWHLNYSEAFFFAPLNLLILKMFGKKIVVTFRGADIRNNIDFLPKSIFNKADPETWPEFYQNLIRLSYLQKLKRKFRTAVFTYFADQIVLTGPFLASFVTHFDKIIPYARDLSFVMHQSFKTSKKIRVLHIPSDITAKGTKEVEQTFRHLSKRYSNVEFKNLPKMSYSQALAEIAQADIIIDQLIVGWYGGQAVEAMALGKIVLAFLNPVYLNLVPYGRKIPIINTNIWSFENDLARTIETFNFIAKNYAKLGPDFTKKYHAAEKIASEYLAVYQTTWEGK